nr:hypothetical protein GCM10011355_02070 [Aquisalinus luteolus]
MFLADGEAGNAAPDNVALHVGRFLAVAAGLGAILKTVLMVFADRIRRWRLSRLKGHVIVCGLDEKGRAFLHSEWIMRDMMGERYPIIAMTPDPQPGDEAWCRGYDIELVAADYHDIAALEAVNAGHAQRIIFVGPEDQKNLETALVLDMVSGVRAKIGKSESKEREGALKAYVLIDHLEFWRQISQSDAVERLRERLEVYPLSIRDVAARQFIWEHHLFAVARLRGQERVHMVFDGYDPYAFSLLYTMLPAILTTDLGRTRVTILTDRANARDQELRLVMPEIDRLADIAFVEHEGSVSPSLMQSVESEVPVTAVFLFAQSDTVVLERTLALHTAMTRTGCWRAPLFPRMDSYDGIRSLTAPLDGSRRFHDAIRPWGLQSASCSVSVFEGNAEFYAQSIHTGYVTSRHEQFSPDNSASRQESLNAWNRLSETKRQSNRRGADHIPAKLASAGCHIPPHTDMSVPDGFTLIHRDEMEAMADLEHQSWMAGRWVDGWRAGRPRDDARRIHPDLLNDYDGLTEELKQYDRNQVQLLSDQLLQRTDKPTHSSIRHEYWLGIAEPVGGEADEQTLAKLVETVLPTLIAEHPDRFWTLLCRPAQGCTSVLTPAVLDYFSMQKLPHRLILLDAGTAPLATGLEGHARLEWIVELKGDAAVSSYLNNRARTIIIADGAGDFSGPALIDASRVQP